MDEIAILASVGSALLAGAAGFVFGRGTAEEQPVFNGSRQLETYDSAQKVTLHDHNFARLQGDKAYCIVAGCDAVFERQLNG